MTSAVLLASAFPPLGLSFLAWFALVPWFLGLKTLDPLRAYAVSAVAGTLYVLLGASWLHHVGWPALLATAVLSGLQIGLFGPLASLAYRHRRLPAVISVSACWVAIEHLRGTLFFTAFPWLYLAHTQAGSVTLVQVAELGGAPLVSYVIASINAAIAGTVGASAPRRVREAGLALLLVAAAFGYGMLRLGSIETTPGPRIAAIQGNVPQEIKTGGRNAAEIYAEHRNLMDAAMRASTEAPFDLAVWPETMLPIDLIERASPNPDRGAFLEQVQAWGRPLIAGAFTSLGTEARPRYHNSAYLLLPAATGTQARVAGRYDKVRLVPASERVPFEDAIPALARLIDAFVPDSFVSMTPGKGPLVFEVAKHRIVPDICFEVSFADLFRKGAEMGAEVFVSVSNDGWFRDSAELDMAVDLAVFRAVETRRAVVRVVNTGVSCHVDALGRREILEDAQGKRKQISGWRVFETRTTAIEQTAYVLYGDMVAWYAIVGALLAALFGLPLPPADAAPKPTND